MKGRSPVIHVLLLLLPYVAASTEEKQTAAAVVAVRKPCAEGCGLRGHCNYEEGRCECPWGFTGPACEVDTMAACRQTPDDPGSCGLLFPKNCECYRACYRLLCHHGTDIIKCTHQWGTDIHDATCWLYGNNVTGWTSHPQNSSWYPEHPENETVWFKEIPELSDQTEYLPSMIQTDPRRLYKSPWHRPYISWHHANHTAYPLSACPNRCSNGRGYCLQYSFADSPACFCHYGYNGTDCSQEDNFESCWFSPDCGGRGSCRSGFCHCRDGYWGFGCRRSLAFQPAAQGALPDSRLRSGLKIYMYELPWEVAFPYEVKEDAHTRDPMYSAYESFLKYFLDDTFVRTENPYEANLFYLPALTYFYVENVRNPNWQAERVINYVRHTWPFYNRTGGRDHFMFLTGDRGACDVERWLQDDVIKLVHFGLQRPNVSWETVKNKDYGCVRVKQDLVVPPSPNGDELLFPTHTEGHYKRLVAAGGRDANRTLLFFFAGGVGDGEYSGGTRAAIQQLLHNMTQPVPDDIMFVSGRTESYHQLLTVSKFCIAPYGWGWGIRVMTAMHFGCIPVIIQDHVYQPLEEFLPYEEFSVRMPLSAVPRMVEILRSFSEDQLASLRLGMAKYFRAFIWNRDWGGRAYEWTLVGLQRRAYNLQGEYFRRQLMEDNMVGSSNSGEEISVSGSLGASSSVSQGRKNGDSNKSRTDRQNTRALRGRALG